MLLRLILLLTVVPIFELMLILKVHGLVAASWGSNLALLTSLGSILITGAVGATIARRQGLSLLMKLQKEMQQGQLPGQTMIEGVLVLVGGALLLTPGYLTDITGFLLILPVSRPFIAAALQKRLQAAIVSGQIRMHHQGAGGFQFYTATRGPAAAANRARSAGSDRGATKPEPDVIEADYEDLQKPD